MPQPRLTAADLAEAAAVAAVSQAAPELAADKAAGDVDVAAVAAEVR